MLITLTIRYGLFLISCYGYFRPLLYVEAFNDQNQK